MPPPYLCSIELSCLHKLLKYFHAIYEAAKNVAHLSTPALPLGWCNFNQTVETIMALKGNLGSIFFCLYNLI